MPCPYLQSKARRMQADTRQMHRAILSYLSSFGVMCNKATRHGQFERAKHIEFIYFYGKRYSFCLFWEAEITTSHFSLFFFIVYPPIFTHFSPLFNPFNFAHFLPLFNSSRFIRFPLLFILFLYVCFLLCLYI
jgi:hypothetical protein